MAALVLLAACVCRPPASGSRHYLYVTCNADDTILAFEIQPDGTLTAIGTFPSGSQPEGIVVSPNGDFLYVTDQSDNKVYAFTIGSDGRSVMNSIPFADPIGADAVREWHASPSVSIHQLFGE